MRAARADRSSQTKDGQQVEQAEPLGESLGDVRRLAEDERSGLAQRVSQDWGAEREADQVADVASRGHQGPAVEGGALAPSLQARMAAVDPGLQRLGDVRFDTGPDAAKAADSIGARAFTAGTDVAVGRGELDAGLAAHEAVHAVQHRDGMVHAKMRGARAAIGDLGGSKSTKVLRLKTNWDKILDGVAAYEALEEALLKGGNPSTQVLAAAKPKMLKTLSAVRAGIKAWEKANDSEGESSKSEEWTKKLSESGEKQTSDDRTKAERRQAIAMLLPRVNSEIALLQSKDPAAWTNSLGLSSEKIESKGREDGGQKNKVSELKYQTESGEFSGFFKAEKGFAGDMEGHEADVGIQMADPNYGARSVAMYKLDQLLKAGVTARAEFATHVDDTGKTVFGTVLESAKGVTGSDAKIGSSQEHAKQLGSSAFSLDDPVFQSCMNKMQVFDAICGQLDRHDGNYYVQVDENNQVTGVTGIDLDMAFGKELKGDMKAGKYAPNFKGIPDKIDAEFGEALLKVSSKDIGDVLRGLLPEPEIAATISRFEAVRSVVQKLKQSEGLVQKWGSETTSQKTGSDLKFQSGRKGYEDNAAFGSLITIGLQIKDLTSDAIGSGSGPSPFQSGLWTREIDSLPDVTRDLLLRAIAGGENLGAIPNNLRNVAYEEKIGEQVPELTMLVVNELLRDTSTMAKLSVMVQEDSRVSSSDLANVVDKMLDSTYIPNARKKLPKKKPKGGTQPSEEGKSKGRTSLIGSRGRR